jgi:hypothetical protein
MHPSLYSNDLLTQNICKAIYNVLISNQEHLKYLNDENTTTANKIFNFFRSKDFNSQLTFISPLTTDFKKSTFKFQITKETTTNFNFDKLYELGKAILSHTNSLNDAPTSIHLTLNILVRDYEEQKEKIQIANNAIVFFGEANEDNLRFTHQQLSLIKYIEQEEILLNEFLVIPVEERKNLLSWINPLFNHLDNDQHSHCILYDIFTTPSEQRGQLPDLIKKLHKYTDTDDKKKLTLRMLLRIAPEQREITVEFIKTSLKNTSESINNNIISSAFTQIDLISNIFHILEDNQIEYINLLTPLLKNIECLKEKGILIQTIKLLPDNHRINLLKTAGPLLISLKSGYKQTILLKGLLMHSIDNLEIAIAKIEALLACITDDLHKDFILSYIAFFSIPSLQRAIDLLPTLSPQCILTDLFNDSFITESIIDTFLSHINQASSEKKVRQIVHHILKLENYGLAQDHQLLQSAYLNMPACDLETLSEKDPKRIFVELHREHAAAAANLPHSLPSIPIIWNTRKLQWNMSILREKSNFKIFTEKKQSLEKALINAILECYRMTNRRTITIDKNTITQSNHIEKKRSLESPFTNLSKRYKKEREEVRITLLQGIDNAVQQAIKEILQSKALIQELTGETCVLQHACQENYLTNRLAPWIGLQGHSLAYDRSTHHLYDSLKNTSLIDTLNIALRHLLPSAIEKVARNIEIFLRQDQLKGLDEITELLLEVKPDDNNMQTVDDIFAYLNNFIVFTRGDKNEFGSDSLALTLSDEGVVALLKATGYLK